MASMSVYNGLKQEESSKYSMCKPQEANVTSTLLKNQQILRSRKVEILPTGIVFADILIYIDINYILKILHILHKTSSVFTQP